MKKYLLCSALFLTLIACGKMDSNTKMYDGRVCEDIRDAFDISTCQNKCSGKVEGLTSFEIDSNANKVVQTDWKGKNKEGVHVLDGCKVADKENWSCREQDDFGLKETSAARGKIVSLMMVPSEGVQMVICYFPKTKK